MGGTPQYRRQDPGGGCHQVGRIPATRMSGPTTVKLRRAPKAQGPQRHRADEDGGSSANGDGGAHLDSVPKDPASTTTAREWLRVLKRQ